jgi:hypothetical protein
VVQAAGNAGSGYLPTLSDRGSQSYSNVVYGGQSSGICHGTGFAQLIAETMGFTTYANDQILNAYGQAASLGGPATHYVGLLNATTFQASSSYSSGAHVIPTTFGTIAGQEDEIFKCTTAGTSGWTQPTWTRTEGGTNADGSVTWTEVSLLFQAGTFTGAEVSGNNYARVAVTAKIDPLPERHQRRACGPVERHRDHVPNAVAGLGPGGRVHRRRPGYRV